MAAVFLESRPALTMAIAVLAYHSQDICGHAYHHNDHVALAEDLRQIAGLGLKVIAAADLAIALATGTRLPERAVVLTCDDGAELDFVDHIVAGHGMQKGFYRILREAEQTLGLVNMTSFVIADPESRATLERTCLNGEKWLGEAWWATAVASGIWHVGVHSWDHHHPTLARYSGRPIGIGEFRGVDNYAEADIQVRAAAAYLRARAPNPADRLFAYPYGNWTEYLTHEYFPHHADEHGIIAAFTTEPDLVRPETSRWRIPRYVCRMHWRSPGELGSILKRL